MKKHLLLFGIYAIIQGGQIINTIVIDDPTQVTPVSNYWISHGAACVVEVDQVSPEPGIGWTSDCIHFSQPSGD